MSAGKKPVWLEEQAHTLIKEYSKLVKLSMTEITSALVLDGLAELEGGAEAAPVAAPTPVAVVEAKSTIPEEEVLPTAPPAQRFVATAPETRLEPPRPEPPAPPRRERGPRKESDELRYLGGIWLV